MAVVDAEILVEHGASARWLSSETRDVGEQNQDATVDGVLRNQSLQAIDVLMAVYRSKSGAPFESVNSSPATRAVHVAAQELQLNAEPSTVQLDQQIELATFGRTATRFSRRIPALG